jgi:sterol desaturase/sphingolipid hydroxylase (fatty acid hydroxylase superfamily)
MISHQLGTLAAAVAGKFAQVWYLYLLAAISTGIGAFLCYRQERPRPERSVPDFIAYVFPKRVMFHPSARLDLYFVAVRWLTRPLLITPFLFSSALVGQWIAGELARVFGPLGSTAPPPLASRILLTVAVVVASDLGIFCAHYLQHRVPVLWEFHKVHHAAEVLIPPTVLRIHPVDDIGRELSIALCIAVASSGFLYVYPAGIAEVAVAGVEGYLVLELLIFSQLRHSHLPLRFGAGLERMLVSPAMHQLHHSVDPRHHDKNFGLAFAVWDRLLGTLMLPDKVKPIGELGLSNGEGPAYNSLWALYALPFVKLLRRRRPSIDKPVGSVS